MTFSRIFIPDLLPIAQDCKLVKGLSIREWTNKLWYIHSMEYYLVTERKNTDTHTTRMNFKTMKVSERSQT